MARVLVSVVVNWDAHMHDSTALCARLTVTATYTDDVMPNYKGSNTYTPTWSISVQGADGKAIRNAITESGLRTKIVTFLLATIPGSTTTSILAVTTIVKSSDYA